MLYVVCICNQNIRPQVKISIRTIVRQFKKAQKSYNFNFIFVSEMLSTNTKHKLFENNYLPIYENKVAIWCIIIKMNVFHQEV